jgi:tol-pal system protein YbgF
MTKGHSIKSTFLLLFVLLMGAFFIVGCGSSRVVVEEDQWADQWDQEEAAAPSQLEQLQADNAELREELARQTQENRTLNARIAELEKRILEERERIRELEEARVAAPPPPPPPTTSTAAEFDREYTRAMNLFMERKYSEAKDLFTRLLNSNVNHPLIPNCQYWIGESLFGMREYREAITEFQKVFGYSSQVKHDDAQIMIANSYYLLGDRQRARQEYQKLLDQYPNSDYVVFARQRLQEF